MKNLIIKSIIIICFLYAVINNDLYASTRQIKFENKTGQTVDDLHIEFTHKETVWDDTKPHTFPSERHEAGKTQHNFYGTAIANGGSATLTFKYDGTGDLTINRWWWTSGGTAIADGVKVGDIKNDDGSNLLSWNGGPAMGNGMVAVSIGGVNNVFHTTPGSPAMQTAQSFLAFINSNFNSGPDPNIYTYMQSPNQITIAGNILGDPSRELFYNIMQDNNQPLSLSPSIGPILYLSDLIEGLYNPASGKMVMDYATVSLRDAAPPFNLVEYTGGSLDTLGRDKYYFYNAVNGVPYFIEVTHRNSIETWSSNICVFNSNQAGYDFTNSPAAAFGGNVKHVGTKYCNYSGDANQDGFVNLPDLIQVYNDASNYVIGYVPSDMDGNKIVDLSDLIFTYNNAVNFVTVMRP